MKFYIYLLNYNFWDLFSLASFINGLLYSLRYSPCVSSVGKARTSGFPKPFQPYIIVPVVSTFLISGLISSDRMSTTSQTFYMHRYSDHGIFDKFLMNFYQSLYRFIRFSLHRIVCYVHKHFSINRVCSDSEFKDKEISEFINLHRKKKKKNTKLLNYRQDFLRFHSRFKTIIFVSFSTLLSSHSDR